jgi:hypothetical protein
MDPPNTLIKLIRSTLEDDSIKPVQIKKALKMLWIQPSEKEIPSTYKHTKKPVPSSESKVKEYNEEHHLNGKPQEVVELFKTFDKFCRELDPRGVQREALKHYIKYTHGNNIFCCVHIHKSGLRVWLKLNYSDLESPAEYVRDVSNIGHWGVGDVELTIDSLERFQNAKNLIQKSFEENKSK